MLGRVDTRANDIIEENQMNSAFSQVQKWNREVPNLCAASKYKNPTTLPVFSQHLFFTRTALRISGRTTSERESDWRRRQGQTKQRGSSERHFSHTLSERQFRRFPHTVSDSPSAEPVSRLIRKYSVYPIGLNKLTPEYLRTTQEPRTTRRGRPRGRSGTCGGRTDAPP